MGDSAGEVKLMDLPPRRLVRALNTNTEELVSVTVRLCVVYLGGLCMFCCDGHLSDVK